MSGRVQFVTTAPPGVVHPRTWAKHPVSKDVGSAFSFQMVARGELVFFISTGLIGYLLSQPEIRIENRHFIEIHIHIANKIVRYSYGDQLEKFVEFAALDDEAIPILFAIKEALEEDGGRELEDLIEPRAGQIFIYLPSRY